MTGLEVGEGVKGGVGTAVGTSAWVLTGFGSGVALAYGYGAVGTSGSTWSGTRFACGLAEVSTE